MESDERRLWTERNGGLVWVGRNVEEEEELFEAKVKPREEKEDRSESVRLEQR